MEGHDGAERSEVTAWPARWLLAALPVSDPGEFGGAGLAGGSVQNVGMTMAVEVSPARAVRAPAWRRPAVVATALVTLAVLLRLTLLAAGYPPADSDEAAMGLGALHIAAGRDFPVFLYGQHYMGAVEAYLAAGLLALHGPSVFLLRLPLIALYVVFMVAMYRLTARLYTAWFAVAVLGVLAFGADRVLKDQLVAHGGSAELKPVAALLVLTGLVLATGWRTRRGLGFFCWGVLAGFAVWDHLLILPYLALAGAFLLARCWRELAGRMGGWLVLGLLLGAAPLIGYNLVAAPGEDSVTVFLRQNSGPAVPWADRLDGGVLLGVPLSTGVCDPGSCQPWQRTWGVLCVVLLATSCWLAVRTLRRTPAGAAQERARQLGRLVLALAALVSVAAYTRSSAAGLTPMESARYLSVLPVSVPAVLWPLWTVWGRLRWLTVLGSVVLVGAFGWATVGTVRVAVPAARADARTEWALLDALDAAGIRRLYTEYWTCNRLIFDSAERITCAVVGDDLRAGWDRYAPYRAALASDPRPWYVFPAGSPPDTAFQTHLRARGVPADPVRTVAGYHFYRPADRPAVPLPP
jgi:hypothetical protein